MMWLYHKTLKATAPKIAREGLIPSGCQNGIGERVVCGVLDDINPIRPASVYMASKNYHGGIYCYDDPYDPIDDEWFAIRADTIPCRCKQMNHDLTGNLYLAIEGESSRMQHEVLEEMGYDYWPMGTDEWDDRKEKQFWKKVDGKRRELVNAILSGNAKPSIRLQYRLWNDTVKDFDGLDADYNEVLCPCAIPPDLLKMPCPNIKGVRKYG